MGGDTWQDGGRLAIGVVRRPHAPKRTTIHSLAMWLSGFSHWASRSMRRTGFHTFLHELAGCPGQSGVGLLYREAGELRPGLDVYVLWPQPFAADDDCQLDSMDEVGRIHGALARAIDGTADTFLDLVTGETCPDLTAFAEAMQEWQVTARQSCLLGVAAIPSIANALIGIAL